MGAEAGSLDPRPKECGLKKAGKCTDAGNCECLRPPQMTYSQERARIIKAMAENLKTERDPAVSQ